MQNSSNLFGKEIDSIDEFLSTALPSYPFQAKRGFAAFAPAFAGLATIAVESIGSFLQKKCNTALSKGLIAIKSDQSLAWNSTKQLEDDFFLYGKYNLDSLEKIIHTINHLGDRVHQMEKLLLGKDCTVATQQFLHSSYIGRLLFAHKLNIYLTSIQYTPNLDNLSPFELTFGRKPILVPRLENTPHIPITVTFAKAKQVLEQKLKYLREKLQKFRDDRLALQNKDKELHGQIVSMFVK